MGDHVRAILWDHAVSFGAAKPPAHDDPNDLLDAAAFRAALPAEHARDAGRAYARLWARTFHPLIRQWRGEPERALHALAHEVLPHLRDRLLAARAERIGRRHWRIVCDDALPGEYVAGMAEGFMALAAAPAQAAVAGPGIIDVHFRVAPGDWVSRGPRRLASFRLPLLATSTLAAVAGVTAAVGSALDARALAVILGALSAQAGANAAHDLLGRLDHHPFARPRLPRAWLWFQLAASYATASACLTFLASATPWIVAFAGGGLVLGLGYAWLRDSGWGPIVSGIAHGPLVVTGAFVAMAQPTSPAMWLTGIAIGLLAAARTHLDDLADRPLDEAAGRRTLAVRLPMRRDGYVYSALLIGGAALVPVVVALQHLAWAWVVSLLIVAALSTSMGVLVTDDPRGLGNARLATLGLFVASTMTLILAEVLA